MNKLAHKLANAKWYKANKTFCNKTSTTWKQANRGRVREYMVQWHKEHPEEAALQYAKRKLNHPSRVNWECMIGRCYDPKHPRYAGYGAKGITVYKAWQSFETYEQEFGQFKPGIDYTVDRLNNELGYYPGNVRWATKSEQVSNRHGRGPNHAR